MGSVETRRWAGNGSPRASIAAGGDDGSALLSSKRLRLRVSILPAGLANVQTSVEHSLQNLLLRYSESINGVIVAYNGIEIRNLGRGKIVEDLPHIHYEVDCDALVFTPLPETQLKGRVTGFFHSHLSLVVLGFFNASISSEHLRKGGFEYDPAREVWYDLASEYTLEKGSYVHFVIEKFHEAAGVMSIDGCSPRIDF
jgi:DNA-directed RNA polymerase subunit E'/Rpb7